MNMVAQIINRGRGPEIAGTRITVYDVLDYRKHGWHRDQIAAFFRLSSNQIQAAFDYIDSHHEEVMTQYQKILDFHKNYTYPPEVQAKIDATAGAAARRRDELRAMKAKHNGNGEHAQDSGRS
jgi:uncharacterized protein (DUF433 family)